MNHPRLILAYPHEYLPKHLGFGEGQVVTIANDTRFGPGWPGFIRGPDVWDDPIGDTVDFLRSVVEPTDILVPLCEEAVLPCSMVESAGGVAEHGLACVDRRVQRLALDPAGLNPRWGTNGPPGGLTGRLVVKAPVSERNRGVCVTTMADLPTGILAVWRDNPYLARTVELHPPGYTCVVEEYVEGPQFEVNGITGPDPARPLHVFQPIRQHWRGEHIERYEPVFDSDLRAKVTDLACRAVRTLGLRWTGWNVEIRQDRVIEINGRLGEEIGKNYRESLGVGAEVDPAVTLVAILLRELEHHAT